MPNLYFQFKQFTICHNRCAMKVGTDGVLLGAWCHVADAKKGLDVGTGSGLIALMMAQRNSDLVIDAIDIDEDAIGQARENAALSPWGERIACEHISVQDMAKNRIEKYDTIVSNPPFFMQSLKSPNRQRTLARHTDSLLVEELIGISAQLLADGGRLSLVFPYQSKGLLVDLGTQNGLSPLRITDVYPTATSTPKRVLMEFVQGRADVVENSLILEKERHVYTDEFRELVREFYLRL